VAKAPRCFFEPGTDPQLAYARAKDYFDYNYNLNAQVILGAAVRATCPFGTMVPSKYGLQALYFLRGRQRCQDETTEMDLLLAMENGFGTGKYPKTRMGSPITFPQILLQLVASGLVQSLKGPSSRPAIQITDLGEHLLSALHPDCEDPDLAARLQGWCEEGLASRPKMDRYLRTFFGKQKRFASKAGTICNPVGKE
jgi:hypothetical protein